jgi:hypothetical protein
MCLTKYAEQKSKRAGDDVDLFAYSNPWRFCNNCKQLFQGQLSIDLGTEFVSFSEATYGQEGNNKWDKLKVIDSLCSKMAALSDKQLSNMQCTGYIIEDIRAEMTIFINKLLDTVKQTKQDST